ncbi:MAG TPA: lytic murein transglycosylase [Xanthobacteraceae bacterium]|nr:lytic murein transglycosylase [Xanthobacteraceae bacterium]
MRLLVTAAIQLFVGLAALDGSRAADAAFAEFLRALRPEAEALGVSRATFERATRDLAPDLSLPDLVIPGRPERPEAGQAEFVQTPAQYLDERNLARMAEQGRRLAAQHRETLARMERQFGVPGPIILAVWGRETGYGGAKLPHNAIRALATQAYLGRRKEQFRHEFLLALKMVEEGHARIADMRSSWAGAMGLTQLLPSDFYKSAVDFDADGRIDIWHSAPDALASAAKQLVVKGWQRGRRWAHEVRVPENVDCTIAHPGFVRPMREWIEQGYAPADGRKLDRAALDEAASLLMPEGAYGPAFLTPKNYFVLKDYNFSDLYVLFVGNLADRIAGGGAFKTPWSKNKQLRAAEVETMQRRLAQLGLYQDKIDGKAGMLTRSALGAYQKANGLKLDCWPTAAVLRHMQASAGSN